MLNFDDLDLKLLSELKKDGSISVPVLAKKLEMNSSVLYSRIKRLIKKKIIKKFTIDIDDAQLGYEVKASVGINRDPKFKEIIQQSLLNTSEVTEICEITGRFDIIIKILAEDLEQLHTIIIDKIGKIDGIQNTETFVELEKIDKTPIYLSKN
jgi:Lrp/AsnC family transcriptional regulator for asnA, asnC and gidA|tara:strand:+ start:538 stop:996 length:459 start_codon:yes stop_codon:yes gene_type:complete